MAETTLGLTQQKLIDDRSSRALIIGRAGGIDQALAQGEMQTRINTTLSEAIILGLIRQGVRKYLSVFGHGTTEIGEVLRIYQEKGAVQVFNVRSEIEASHAATALRWVTGEKAAVVTSIGPGALQAMAASLAPASDGIGVWYLLGDETTEDEADPSTRTKPVSSPLLHHGLCV
jgi:3D-(3,5/4)-trihydroxycyclohexane-1,2-dione acylhydrolase (decyclizing)